MCDKKTMVGITLLISDILLTAIIPQTISVKVYAQLPGIIAEQNQGQTSINEAGATFLFPLIDTWRAVRFYVFYLMLLLLVPYPEGLSFSCSVE